MRFMMLPRSSKTDGPRDAPHPFDDKVLVALMKYNEEMHKAGVLLASEGLNPADPGAHIRFTDGKGTVVDGPFAETKELIGGFYMIETATKAEAIAWALRYPGGFGNDDVVELRPMTGPGDLPDGIKAMIEKAAPTWSAAFLKGHHK